MAKKGRPRRKLDESTYSNRLATRIQGLMDKAGLTAEALRNRLAQGGYEASVSTIQAWAAGRNRVDIDVIPHLARALDVSCRTVFPKE